MCATIKQKVAAKKTLENLGNNTIQPMGKVMIESGYKESVAKNPKILTESKGFQELLASIDDDIVLKKVFEILMGDDKRSSLTAADMLLKLKDKYPAQKSKIMGLFQAIDNLKE